jgi:hypothetical protein
LHFGALKFGIVALILGPAFWGNGTLNSELIINFGITTICSKTSISLVILKIEMARIILWARIYFFIL